ncbi:adenylate cyclase type 9 isoform X2 [Onthophagus taurus]|uniref:adenylate cyclase type 9 isoform X2 n=1 Tax=Onthophagus taurus TaxID=166361 RepID=UPI0039BEACFB
MSATAEKRVSSFSYTTSDSQNLNEYHDEDAAQCSHEVQLYLAQLSQKSGCWGGCIPVPFERAARKSWWDPMFDSEILEEQFKKSALSHHTHKFRYGLFYILLVSFVWFLYFLCIGITTEIPNWPTQCAILAVFTVVIILLIFLTFTKFCIQRLSTISLCTVLALCVTRIFFVIPLIPDEKNGTLPIIGHVGKFSICAEILMLIFTIFPLRFYICIVISVTYTALFEIVTWLSSRNDYDFKTVTIRLMVHFCIHLIGIHILIMNNIRMRNTFMKVGQSLLARSQLEKEQILKKEMILSLMPPSVASWLMNDDRKDGKEPRYSDPETGDIAKSLFRPFNMIRIENVSILFADIVGFTKMSSTKTAEELVVILNTLFRSFDILCREHHCEKISTLGDCYYCVSGCPDPVPDHAKCCVEMGLSMIKAIKDFDTTYNEGINMRVGIHTGTILCGIVGTKRFKFDVWSNDVTLANTMESTSKPGMIHISETTRKFLDDDYLLEDAPQVSGLKTYLILGKTINTIHSRNSSFKRDETKLHNSVQLKISPAPSPPSLSPQTRPRVLSCDNSLKPTTDPNFLSPDACRVKASSLPSILDSENEQDFDPEQKEQVKTPTSTASSGKYSMKLKSWRIPKFLKKNELIETNNQDEYQQVPIIVEDQTLNGKKIDSTSWTNLSNCFDEHTDVLFDEHKDGIDVKSYISQSRSDIGAYDFTPNDYAAHFIRTGSYRSQYGRQNELVYLSRAGSNRSKRGKSPVFENLSGERAKSITVPNFERPHKTSLEVPHRLSTILLDDQLSVAHSINSRKDSGIRSNSRKSSIQQIEAPYLHPSNQQRVSGYFTSSQSTLNSPQCNSTKLPPPPNRVVSHQMRKQSDRQLIKCVQDNFKSKHSYFMNPPLSKLSLFFLDKKIEQQYRANVHAINDGGKGIETLANSSFNTYFDILVSVVVFIASSISLFILCEFTISWAITFGLFLSVQSLAVLLCFDGFSNFFERIFNKFKVSDSSFTKWCRWNTFGSILVSLPIVAILVNYNNSQNNYLYMYLLFVGVINFCNFTQLNWWMCNILVVIYTVVYVLLRINSNSLDFDDAEIFTSLFLLLVLVWMLNREFEKAYRSNFHAHYEASRDQNNMLKLKEQADFLIYNILPEHVANQLKKDAKYSENFKNVGIIFASIVNFNEMYDESYMGGREFLRVLNELIGDFDELLMNEEFYCVEKIKTIGSTFMAASGLDSKARENQEDPYNHLYALMEFAIAMQDVVEKFNNNLLEFNLILRIGYNFGDVTAAVIGETKLYYDIWGDAVNIASRMDSTGVNGRIQVGEMCLNVLERRYIFEKRGSVYVKGKDNMNVYLLSGKKE